MEAIKNCTGSFYAPAEAKLKPMEVIKTAQVVFMQD
jgi:hypothetical protein